MDNKYPCDVTLAYEYYIVKSSNCKLLEVPQQEEHLQRWESEETKEEEEKIKKKLEMARKEAQETQDILDIGMRTLGLSLGKKMQDRPSPAFLKDRVREAEEERQVQRASDQAERLREVEAVEYEAKEVVSEVEELGYKFRALNLNGVG